MGTNRCLINDVNTRRVVNDVIKAEVTIVATRVAGVHGLLITAVVDAIKSVINESLPYRF